jgi:hypothetical protein
MYEYNFQLARIQYLSAFGRLGNALTNMFLACPFKDIAAIPSNYSMNFDCGGFVVAANGIAFLACG